MQEEEWGPWQPFTSLWPSRDLVGCFIQVRGFVDGKFRTSKKCAFFEEWMLGYPIAQNNAELTDYRIRKPKGMALIEAALKSDKVDAE